MKSQIQAAELCAFFPPNEHEFIRGMTYIKEDKIADRLDAVDPNWEFILSGCQRNGNSVVAYGTLIVCGVRRDGVGMDVVRTKTDTEINEAEKSAATDAFKRAARLHGIGRYLLDLPKSVTDEKTLRNWMKEQKYGTPVQTIAPTRRIPDESVQTQRKPLEAYRVAELETAQIHAWLKGIMELYGISSAEALKAIGGSLTKWQGTLGEAEAAIKAKMELDHAHNQNQQQNDVNEEFDSLTEPVDFYWVNEIKTGKNIGKHYLSIAGVSFFDGDGEILRKAGFNTEVMRNEPLGKHDLGASVQVAYAEEVGSGGKTNKKPVGIVIR